MKFTLPINEISLPIANYLLPIQNQTQYLHYSFNTHQMAISPFQTLDVIELMEQFLERNRPSKHIRKDLDVGYRIDNQSVIVFEVRPMYLNPSMLQELEWAKATYIKSRDRWKIYWMRSSGWYPYTPPEMKTLKAFVKAVEEDPYGCFKG